MEKEDQEIIKWQIKLMCLPIFFNDPHLINIYKTKYVLLTVLPVEELMLKTCFLFPLNRL